MYKNYEKRVKNFIIEMNEPDTKIEIKDYEERINNPKTDMSKEKEIQKPFIFKGYTTEEDRIKDSIKRNRYLFNLPDYDDETNVNKKEKHDLDKKQKINVINDNKTNSFKKLSKKFNVTRKNLISKTEENKYKYILKNDLIIQPEMRFKPRTDLERVYDMINGYKLGQARRDILDKQLKNVGLYKYKNSKELQKRIKKEIKTDSTSSDSENENTNLNSKILKAKKDKLYFDPNSVDFKEKPWMKRIDLNADAYKILNSYHYKTHFKAAREVAENENRTKGNVINNNNHKNKYCLLLPNLFQNKSTTFNHEILNHTYNDAKNKSEEDLIDININNEDDLLSEKDMKIKYDKNKNPFKTKKIFEKNKIKLIKDIAFNKVKKGRNNKKDDYDENKLFDKNIDEDNIMIDDEVYNKKKQFELITNKILDKCNIFNHKSKFNNTILKKRNGKLMFTRGLSVNQFEKKYGF